MVAQETIDAFLQWADERGGFEISKLKIEKVEHGLGLKAKVPCPPKEPILRIPFSSTLSQEYIRSTSLWENFRQCGIQNPGLTQYADSDTVCLLLFLVLGRNNSSSEWFPYLATLPDSSPDPCAWEECSLNLLQGTSLGNSCSKAMNELRSIHEVFLPALLAFCSSAFLVSPAAGGSEVPYSVSLADLVWARGMYISRRFPADMLGMMNRENVNEDNDEGRDSSRSHVSADNLGVGGKGRMIPFLDMSNHNRTANVTWLVQDESISLVCDDGYSEGQEVANNYGLKPNMNLLFAYGFCERASPHDTVQVNVMLGGDVPRSLGIFQLRQTHLGGIQPELFQAISILRQTAATGEAVVKEEDGAPVVEVEDVEMLLSALSRKLQVILSVEGEDTLILDRESQQKLKIVESSSREPGKQTEIIESEDCIFVTQERVFIAYFLAGQRLILRECIETLEELLGGVEGYDGELYH